MKATHPPSPPADSAASFEQALKALEALVQTLEEGDMPLEEALAAYERGMGLVNHCQQTLNRAEQKIRQLDHDTLREFTAAQVD